MVTMVFAGNRLLSQEETDRLGIGANSPPPLESWTLHIEELMAEAQGFLDGEPIANQAQADSVGKLLGLLREARKGADEQRAIEKKPHDDAGKAVQAAWKPIIERADLAADVAKKALAPFLAAEDARKREEAAKAREEAEHAQAAAQAALAAASGNDLAAREEVERLLKQASQADRAANRAEKDKPMAAGHGRAVSLRSVWTATVTDRRAALNHYIARNPEDFVATIQQLADFEARHGPRTAPGITFNKGRIAQ